MSAIALPGSRSVALTPAGIAVWTSVAFAVLHLAVAGRVGLSVDEAHYALYGLHLDWSYFDHPPLVGWLMAPVVALTGDELALRVWPAVLSLVAAGLVYRLARTLFPGESHWVAAVAVLLLQSALVFQVLSVGLVPELPLLVMGLGAGSALYRAVQGGGLKQWLVTGILFGLSGLSKYTAVTLVVTALAFVAWQGRWRLLRDAGPWLGASLAALLITPVVYWNATHEWISFSYQVGHGAPDRDWSITRFLTSQAAQLLAYGPLLYLGGLAAVFRAVADSDHPGVRFSLVFGGPVLLLFAWGGGFEETLPHWTLLGWAALAPLTARWLLSGWGRRKTRILAWVGAGYAGILALVIHGALWTPWLPASDYHHPLGDLHGWQQGARLAAKWSDITEADAIYVTNWTHASRIAWYARPRPVQVLDSRHDQFDLWYGGPKPGDSGILLVNGQKKAKAERYFEQCEQVETLIYRIDERPVHHFRLLECRGYRK